MNYLIAHPFVSISAGFGAVLIILAWLVANLYRRWRALFGDRAPTAADALAATLQRLTRAERRLEGIEPRLEALEMIGRIAVQKVGFMRFNPFEHTGGDQSFAIVLLDRGDNGIVLSSLYTREGVRVYAKRIRAGASSHPLSNEEQQVLEEAIKS